MQSISKLFAAFASTSPIASQLQGWEYLPDELLHSIVSLLCSFRDLVAFAATCRSWRTAFSSYPPKSTLCSVCPPLLLQLDARVHRKKLLTCKLIDPANQHAALHCQIPQQALDHVMHLVGSSYGQLIYYHCGLCHVVDVCSGAEVTSPHLPLSNDFYGQYCGMLTAPLASASSHVLITTPSSLFDWPIGSQSWSQLKLPVQLQQIVLWNDELIAMDCLSQIYTLQLAPQLALRKIAYKRSCQMIASVSTATPWLAVCGDMLVMVLHCHAFRLDMSTEPAEWVEAKLDNWAHFQAGCPIPRSTVVSCMSPERWGGRNNRLYYAHRPQPWVVLGLGDRDAMRDFLGKTMYYRKLFIRMESFWVYPSMFCAAGR